MSSDHENLADKLYSGPVAEERTRQDRAQRGRYRPQLPTTYKWLLEDSLDMIGKLMETLRATIAWLETEQTSLREEERLALALGTEIGARVLTKIVTPRQSRLASLAILIADETHQLAELERLQRAGLAIVRPRRGEGDKQSNGNGNGGNGAEGQ